MHKSSRVSVEEKLKAIASVLEGRESLRTAGQAVGVSAETIRRWIQNYQSMGADGITVTSTNKQYSPLLKLSAVKDYLSGLGSLSDICKKYSIRSNVQLRRWIMRYNSHEDFKQPSSGGVIYMAKGRKTTQDERIEIVSHCIANNKDYGKTIEQYGVSYQQIYAWVKKYEDAGVDGLADRRGKRKDEDSMTEVERLRAQLKLKEAENLRLQMENELLKKLEALERGIDAD